MTEPLPARELADVPTVEVITRAAVMRDGLTSLQRAFREYSAVPDEPGAGPGEKFTGPIV